MISPYKSNMPTKIIIDSDAKNEIDDQYAITYAVLSGKFDIIGFTATHYGKPGSMEDSYDEIVHVLNLIKRDSHYPVYRGAANSIPDKHTPVDSPAARFIIKKALNGTGSQINIVSIGAITNLASAYLMEPAIKDRVKVIWLAGRAWPKGGLFFNNRNDILAAQVVFDSGMDLTLIPAVGTADKLKITLKDRKFIKGRREIGEYLWKLYRKRLGLPKSIYDVAAIALLAVPEYCKVQTVPRPALLMDGTYDHKNSKGEMKVMTDIDAHSVRQDFFETLNRINN